MDVVTRVTAFVAVQSFNLLNASLLSFVRRIAVPRPKEEPELSDSFFRMKRLFFSTNGDGGRGIRGEGEDGRIPLALLSLRLSLNKISRIAERIALEF